MPEYLNWELPGVKHSAMSQYIAQKLGYDHSENNSFVITGPDNIEYIIYLDKYDIEKHGMQPHLCAIKK